jgi:flagellin
MSLNSINTNNNAMIALQSLNATSSELASTEKQISTGYRVADATDDGAAYAVAQRVRSDVGALTSVNQQLGNVKGLLSTTVSSLNNVSNALISARAILIKLSGSNVQGDTRNQYVSKYQSLISNVKAFIQDSTYAGKSLVGNLSQTGGAIPSTYGAVAVARNETGASYSIGAFSGSALYTAVHLSSTTLQAATSVTATITATGAFTKEFSTLSSKLNTYGSNTSYINNQTTYNSDKIDALNSGLGSLIDADLTKESAKLQALQVRQQLATQALSIANQAPQSLLSLFK